MTCACGQRGRIRDTVDANIGDVRPTHGAAAISYAARLSFRLSEYSDAVRRTLSYGCGKGK